MDYWQNILEEIKKYNLNIDEEKVKLAFYFAQECHEGQYRKSGDDYIMHPVEVTKLLIGMRVDTDTIVAGILHDIVEDTLITLADIKYNFGDAVALLVDGVTKLRALPNGTKKQDENIRKMMIAMSNDYRVIIIKLADRLHNMRTLKFMKPEKQQSIARETLEIYAPLAHRLGIAKIKWELEDLSLYYLEPEKYKEIKRLVDAKKGEREEYINNFIEEIKTLLKQSNIEGSTKGRFKHFYSIYKKLYEKGKDFDDIYDLMGVRIIVDTEAECYHTLGVIHSNFKPVPGRFKDYIAVPKSNNYQSIHTTIVGPLGKFIEIQIRTEEMNKIAEEGIAAHWSYKEKTKISNKDQVYGWLRQIVELQNETENAEDFIKTVTEDIMKETVFVFSPKGDVIELAKGSTPLDFAFSIHSEIGCKCIGAKANGKIVPLEYKLKNGDRVEVITSKNAKGPGNDWLDMVVTQGAKSKIKKWLKDKNYGENLKNGREILEKELTKLGINLKEFEEGPLLKKHMEKHNIPTLEEFYFQIGEKRSKADILLTKIRVELEKNSMKDLDTILEAGKKKKNSKKNDYGIVIEGIDNTLIRFARCCTPLPGDKIGGYITKLTGIAIHRRDCTNYQHMIAEDPDREIEVKWDEAVTETKWNKYKFTFTIIANNRSNILMDVVNLIANHKINLSAVNSSEVNKGLDKLVNIKITIEIKSKVEYSNLVNNLLKIKDVISIER